MVSRTSRSNSTSGPPWSTCVSGAQPRAGSLPLCGGSRGDITPGASCPDRMRCRYGTVMRGRHMCMVQNQRDPGTPLVGACELRVALGERARMATADLGGTGPTPSVRAPAQRAPGRRSLCRGNGGPCASAAIRVPGSPVRRAAARGVQDAAPAAGRSVAWRPRCGSHRADGAAREVSPPPAVSLPLRACRRVGRGRRSRRGLCRARIAGRYAPT